MRRRVIGLTVLAVVVAGLATGGVVLARHGDGDGAGGPGPSASSPSATPSASASAAPGPIAPAPRNDSQQVIQKRLTKLTARKVEELAAQMREPRPATVVQLNMCLSGLARCADRASAGARVAEAVSVIRSVDADAAVVNEACSADAERIAAATGLDLTFSVVPMGNRSLPCRGGGDRGVFGNAVLSGPVVGVQERAYGAQADAEQRRAVCAVLDGLTICGTHLSAVGGSRSAARANDRQCTELSSFVAEAAKFQPTVLTGDLNRRTSCAPTGFTTLTDAGASQARGIQQAFVDDRITVESASTVRMRTTDHDALVVRLVQPPLLPPIP